MSIHHHLRISTKLLLGFGLLALVVLIVSAIAFRSLDRAEHRMEAYLSGIDQRQMLAADLRSAASRRAIAARNLVLATAPADRDGEREAALHAGSELRSTLATLQARLAADGVDPQEHRLVEEIEAVERRYADAVARILALAAEGRRDEAVGRINAECRPLLAALLSALQSYVDHERAQARAQAQAARTADLADQRLLVAVCAAALLSAVVFGVLIGRSITAPIDRAVRAAKAVAAGQLGEPIVVDRRDEAGQLLAALQAMNENLVGMVGRVRESADGIASATSEIATGHRDLSGRTEQQASALQQAAASMHQMTESIERNADSVRRATTLAESVAGAASRGGAAVQRVVETMDDIAAASRKIEAITGVIDAIAFQTNILALNAAVEAARAGEHGRGFAVVASEVRALAQRSGAAAKEINTLIGDSVGKVGHGTRLVREAGQTIEGLVGEVRGMSALMAGIDTANGEQRDGIRQVNLAVTSIDAGTQQNAALVEESTAASESLRTQAEMLRELIGVFRIRAHAA